jgi:hypothetical protein
MADSSLGRLRASVYFFCDEFSRRLSQPTKVQLEGSPLVWTRSTFPIVIINIMTSNSCQCMPFPIGNNTGITACCPKIPAAKKQLKSRGVTEISATSLPSSISQLGNVGNSRASKLLAIFTAIKFQSVVMMQKLRPFKYL